MQINKYDYAQLNQYKEDNQAIIIKAIQSGKLTTDKLMLFIETPIDQISDAATQAILAKLNTRTVLGLALDQLIQFVQQLTKKIDLSPQNKANAEEILRIARS